MFITLYICQMLWLGFDLNPYIFTLLQLIRPKPLSVLTFVDTFEPLLLLFFYRGVILSINTTMDNLHCE